MLEPRLLSICLSVIVAAGAQAAEIGSFVLVDAANDNDIRTLTDGDVIDLAALATTDLNIRAMVIDGTPATVHFDLSGAESHTQDESVAPYALFGDNAGDYGAWTPSVGSYSLSADADGSGAASIAFSVVDDSPSVGDDGDGAVLIGGTLQQWHRVDLSIAALASSQDATPNPFRDYRFNVVFTSPDGVDYDVPGYFAGDGVGGSVGHVWRAHLNPHETGTWSYTVSFRQDSDIAVALSDTTGSAVAPYDGRQGVFTVGASGKSGDDFRAPDRGMLVNRGDHYLTFGGSGAPFLYTGPGIPENILGYRGFTNTTVGVGHEFLAHSNDWDSGDPNWPPSESGLDGRNLIGALNYIAQEGANSLYMMSNTIGGDGKDCFPHPTTTQDKDRYDLRKLHQWDIALSHAQSLGIFLHWHLAEHESGNMNYYGSTAMTVERKLAFRMLNARFGHYNGLKWNLMEECEWDQNERADQMAYLKAVDPYDHPVTWQAGGIGLPRGDAAQNFGDPNMDAGSFQGGRSRNGMFNEVNGWRIDSAAAGVPWTVAWDEPQKIENDNSDQVHGYPMGRRDKMWPCMMAGGDGFMWYIQKDGGGHGFDQRIEDFSIMRNAFNWSGHLRDFLEPLPLMEMTPTQDEVDSAVGNDYALIKSGEVYAIFNDRAGSDMTIDLSGVSGSFDVRWFDPRNGGALQIGTVATINGGDVRDIGAAPSDSDQDWALLVTLSGEPVDTPPTAALIIDQSSVDTGVSVSFDASGSQDDGAIVEYVFDFGDGESRTTTASSVSHSYDSAGEYDVTVSVTDDAAQTDTSMVQTLSVRDPVLQGSFADNGDPWPVPAAGTTRIEAENYDIGGEGVAYHDSGTGNEGGDYRSDDVDVQSTSDDGGGHNVGWIASGEWLEYTIDVAAAGTYDIALRVARQPTSNGALHLEVGDVDLSGPVVVPSTGGWQSWTTITTSIDLDPGVQVLRVAMDAGSFNLNWLACTQQDDNDDPPAVTELIDADFDSDAEGFIYLDDVFRGTNEPAYAAGAFEADGGFADGGLAVTIGGVDALNILGMSGGWQREFTLAAADTVTLTLRYRLDMASNYEADEMVEVLAAIDGTLVAPGATVIDNRAGGATVAWTEVDIDLGTLSAGTHTLTIGIYGNKKTASTESATARFDDVRITPAGNAVPMVVAAINAGGDAFTSAGGIAYSADTGYENGRTYSSNDPIAGTEDDPLYQSERYAGSLRYAIPVANGDYDVTLQFAEIWANANGQRIFDVSVENEGEVVSDLDLYATVGHDAAYDEIGIPVTVTDGVLNITIEAADADDADNGKLSAILVETVPAGIE